MAKKSQARRLHGWAGWIPTVSGQLSFSIIGHSSAARNCACINKLVSDPSAAIPVRYIALHQLRTAPDFPYPDWLTKRYFPGSVYDFICLARTGEADIQAMLPRDPDGAPRVQAVPNAQGVLRGQIFVLLHEKDPDFRARNVAFIERLKADLWLATDADVSQAEAKISARMSDRSEAAPPFLVAGFELFRTGEFRLEIDESEWLRVFEPEDLETALEVIPDQIFYFMKDVVHRHYHHEGSSDQMLELTPLNGTHRTNEVRWRRQTLWGLVRVVMQYRRRGHWPDLQKAKGVAAYAEAFQNSFANCFRAQGMQGGFETTSDLSAYDFKHIKDSIEVSITENAAHRNAMWQGATLGLTAVLAVLLAWSGHAAKMLSMRLAACGSAGDPDHLKGIRDQLGCENIPAETVTSWETLAAAHPFLMILLCILVVSLFASRYLLDVPAGKSWLGRRWQSVRTTSLLFVYALHAQMVMSQGLARGIRAWIKRQVPLALLWTVLGLEAAVMLWALLELLHL